MRKIDYILAFIIVDAYANFAGYEKLSTFIVICMYFAVFILLFDEVNIFGDGDDKK